MNDDSSDLLIMAFALLPAALVAAVIHHVWRGGDSARSRRLWLVAWSWGSVLALLWLDTFADTLALMDPRAVGWLSYAPLTAVLSGVLFAVGLRRAGWRTTGAHVCALWAGSLCLPWIPWNDDKRAILDTREVMDRPLAVAKERLGRYEAEIYDAARSKIAEGRFSELELASFRNGEIMLSPDPVGGLRLTVHDGVVRDVWFNWD